MAFFELNSDITIGKFRFSGVHDVQIKRSMHGLEETAIIKIPSKCKITKKGKTEGEEMITGNQFEEGEHVVIKLGYNGELRTEFMGFVKRKTLNMPMEIECEGYSWLLRRKKAGKFIKTLTVKELLNNMVAGLEDGHKISVVCNVDMSITGVNGNDKTAFDLINQILEATDGTVSCFFIEPDKLWCGLVYTSYAQNEDKFKVGDASFEPGYNCPRDNTLKARKSDNEQVQVKYSKQPEGSKVVISQTSDVFKDYIHEHSKKLNQLDSEQTMKMLANEKAYQLSYSGYEGNINAFLQPYVAPGYKVLVTHPHDKKIEGYYLAESTQVSFGIKGARRIIEVGPILGDVKKQQ